MRVAIDTNVLVSGLLNPFGPPGDIVALVSTGELEICFNAKILSEYHQVLSRPKFPFKLEQIDALMEQIEAGGHLVAARPVSGRLPDPDDEVFLGSAISGGARFLITGNLRHYPPSKRQGIAIVSPAEFLELYRKITG